MVLHLSNLTRSLCESKLDSKKYTKLFDVIVFARFSNDINDIKV